MTAHKRDKRPHPRTGVARADILQTLAILGEATIEAIAERAGYLEVTVRRVMRWLVEDKLVRDRRGAWNRAFFSLSEGGAG